MPKPTKQAEIDRLTRRVNDLIELREGDRSARQVAENELASIKVAWQELVRERNWLRQLCQEQSSSIAGYMRSR